MNITRDIHVKGMYCSGCEKIIEQALLKINGVQSVDADYQKSKIVITFDSEKVQLSLIEEACAAIGYSIVSHSETAKQRYLKIILSVFALFVLVFVFFITRNSGSFISLPEINPQLSDGMIFIVGLLTGVHCVGMCGNFVLGYTTKDMEHCRSPFRSHLLYGVGKTLSYALFGALFGFAGSLIHITSLLSGISISLAGAFLILYGLNMLNIFSILKVIRIKQPTFMVRYASKKKKQSNSPFFIGVFSGFIWGCGPLQVMYVMAAGNGSALEGAKILILFGLGTLPALFGFGLLARFLSNRMTLNFVRASGVILIILGAMMFNKGYIRATVVDEMKSVPCCCHESK